LQGIISEYVKVIIMLYIVTSVVKITILMALFGKPARNIKFSFEVLFSNMIFTLVFSLLSYIFTVPLNWIAIIIYSFSMYAYLMVIALIFNVCSVLIDYLLFYYIFLKGRIRSGELIAALLMASLFAYFFAFEFGAITMLTGL